MCVCIFPPPSPRQDIVRRVTLSLLFSLLLKAEYGLRLASHIFVKDISPESLAARDGNIQEGDVVLKVRGGGGEGRDRKSGV